MRTAACGKLATTSRATDAFPKSSNCLCVRNLARIRADGSGPPGLAEFEGVVDDPEDVVLRIEAKHRPRLAHVDAEIAELADLESDNRQVELLRHVFRQDIIRERRRARDIERLTDGRRIADRKENRPDDVLNADNLPLAGAPVGVDQAGDGVRSLLEVGFCSAVTAQSFQTGTPRFGSLSVTWARMSSSS